MRSLPVVILAFAMATASSATEYSAELLGQHVVPSTPSPGRGFLNMLGTCDPNSLEPSSFSFHIGYQELSQQASGAHIHLGAPGTNGPELYELAGEPFWFLSGVLRIAPEHCEALASGQLYVVIETPESPTPDWGYPEGEVRGQILPEYGQEGEDCSAPIELEITGGTQVFALGTFGHENDVDSLAVQCTGVAATGPDVVFTVDGNEHGTLIDIKWSGNFEAAVYGIEQDCRRQCSFGETGETLETTFESGNYHGDPGGDWRCYIVIDGVDGASGFGTLEIFTSLAVPTERLSWGRIKAIHR